MSDILSQIEEIQGNVRDIKATWGNTIMTLDNIKSSLKGDRQKAIEEAYQKGFEAGQHEATTLEYQQGLDDAWNAARKICNEPEDGGLPASTVVELFGRNGSILGCSAQNAINKLKAYEEQQKSDEIKVGNEVEAYSGRAIVFGTFIDTKGNKFCQYWYPSEGRFDKDKTEHLKKTGRHFPQIAELLEQMKGGAE